MATTPNCVITNAGREIMRGVTIVSGYAQSASFTFTKMAIGNGAYSESERRESSLRTVTALKSLKNEYPVVSFKRISSSDSRSRLFKLSGIASNYDVQNEEVLVSEGYYVTEIGIYAKASGGTEKLAAIALIGDTQDTSENDYIPAVDVSESISGQIYQIVYDMYFGYSNAELNATVQSSGAAYSAEDGQALEDLISPGSGTDSVKIGKNTSDASGNRAVAMGDGTTASGARSTAMGYNSTASGNYATAEGCGTIAASPGQSARGFYNTEDSDNAYVDIVGNGGSTASRSNAYQLTWDGDPQYALSDSEDLYDAITDMGWESEVII